MTTSSVRDQHRRLLLALMREYTEETPYSDGGFNPDNVVTALERLATRAACADDIEIVRSCHRLADLWRLSARRRRLVSLPM